MKKTLLSISLISAIAPAIATTPFTQPPSSSAADADAWSSAASMSSASALSASVSQGGSSSSMSQGGQGGSSSSMSQGGQGGSSSSASQGGAASGGASAATINYSVPRRTTATVRDTPAAVGYAADPTAPCVVTYGLGGSGPGLGFSISGFKEDVKCTVREARRIARDNLDIVREADAYLLEDIRQLRAAQTKTAPPTQSAGAFGY